VPVLCHNIPFLLPIHIIATFDRNLAGQLGREGKGRKDGLRASLAAPLVDFAQSLHHLGQLTRLQRLSSNLHHTAAAAAANHHNITSALPK
jgi:hypothetical protein